MLTWNRSPPHPGKARSQPRGFDPEARKTSCQVGSGLPATAAHGQDDQNEMGICAEPPSTAPLEKYVGDAHDAARPPLAYGGQPPRSKRTAVRTYRARRPLCRDRRLRARRWPRPRPRWRPPGPTRMDRPSAARIAATRSQSSTNRESATWTSPSGSRKRRPVRAPVRVRPPGRWCSPRSGPRPARASRVRSLRRPSPATVRSPRPSTPRTGGTCPARRPAEHDPLAGGDTAEAVAHCDRASAHWFRSCRACGDLRASAIASPRWSSSRIRCRFDSMPSE